MEDPQFEELYNIVMKMLREKLPRNLYYHCPEHTLDVMDAAERIARAENCTPGEIGLLKLAALFHDTGYVRDMRDHEKHGCDIAREMLTERHFDPQQLEVVCNIIMATKIPQTPKTKLEQIICDADLDYLGRGDYFSIAENLYREFLAFEKVKGEKDWIALQKNFLQHHNYFTKTAVGMRQKGKLENLRKIGLEVKN